MSSHDNSTLVPESPKALRRALLMGLAAAVAVPAPAIASIIGAPVPSVPTLAAAVPVGPAQGECAGRTGSASR
jgi:hypothetical protein